MLQRIQSVYLAIVVIAMACVSFFPVAWFKAETGKLIMTSYSLSGIDQAETYGNPIIIGILSIIVGIMAIVVISRFKNRMLQVRLLMVTMLLNLGLIAYIYFLTDKISKFPAIIGQPHYDVASILPLATVVLIILSNRSIRKDEALVKAADRLR
jgi:hypothetical protein